MKIKYDSRNYEAMSVPHENEAAIDSAVDAIFEGVGKLRKKHKMADVLIVVMSPALVDGEPKTFATYCHFGNENAIIPMAANVLERERKRLADKLARMDAIIHRAMESGEI